MHEIQARARAALRPLSLALAATLIPATLVACSPAANALPTALPAADGSAALSPDGSPSASGASTDPAVAWPAFAACLRAHGLQIPDPELGVNGEPQWADGVDLKSSITEAIQQACHPIVAGLQDVGPPRDAMKNYSFESRVAHAGCMRTHGLVDYPDPDPNEPDAGLPAGFQKSDQRVYNALVACEPLLIPMAASPSPSL